MKTKAFLVIFSYRCSKLWYQLRKCALLQMCIAEFQGASVSVSSWHTNGSATRQVSQESVFIFITLMITCRWDWETQSSVTNIKKTGTKLQRQDTHRLNVFIGENIIKMDAAVYITACDLERFSIECRKTKTEVIQTTGQKKGKNLKSQSRR